MTRPATPHQARHPHRRRRTVAALAATAIATAGTLAAVGNPASAAPVAVTDASFEWGVSTEVAAKAPPFGGCNFLSAGASDGTQAAYKAAEGNVSVVRTDAATPTWANKCTGVGNAFQKLRWTGGTGTVDPATGAATLSFTGEVSINFYGGLVPFTIKDPVLTVSAEGEGTLVATMYGWESSMENPTIKVPVAPVNGVVVADLADVDAAGTGFSVTPDYTNVEYTPPAGSNGTPQNRTNPGWGSWPASFVDFHYLTGLTSYWYSSGGAADPFKAPTAITFAYSDVGGGDPDPEPADDEQVISVEIPEGTPTGEFTWSITGDGVVDLGETTHQGTYLAASGELDPISVSDTRSSGASWSISGQVSDFSTGLDGKYLGWSPKIVTPGGGALAGSVVAPGLTSGDGLTAPSLLASAPSGHPSGTASVGADLNLQLPVETPAGSYTATLTITALS